MRRYRITSLSAAAEVITRGLKLNMDGLGTIRVPGRVVNPTAAGAWIAEGNPAPARALSFSNAAILQPRRLSVLYPYSREQAESSNIENIVRQTLGEASGLALDAQMFSATPGDSAKPGGLLAGVAPLVPTALTGTTTPAQAAATDIGNLFAAWPLRAQAKPRSSSPHRRKPNASNSSPDQNSQPTSSRPRCCPPES